MKSEIKLCPKCNETYECRSALSRIDNKTEICDVCAMAEAIIIANSVIENKPIELYNDELTKEEMLIRKDIKKIMKSI